MTSSGSASITGSCSSGSPSTSGSRPAATRPRSSSKRSSRSTPTPFAPSSSPRVAVKIVDFFADRYVNVIHLAAKLADGGREGAITRILFPDGKAIIVEPVGASEITEILYLETRLEKHGGPIAAEHLEPLRKLRKEYEAAVAARLEAMKEAGAQRELRNAARRIFVEGYVANQGAIKEAYPNDRRMQDLFFDDLREARNAGGDEDPAPTPPANG